MFLSALTLWACGDKTKPDGPSSDVALNVSASIVDFSGSGMRFSEGDKIGIFVLNPSVYLENACYVCLSDGSFKAEEKNKWYSDTSKKAALIGYYPFRTGLTAEGEFSFGVQTDQSTAAGYAASDLMLALSTDVTPTADKVPLGFRHVLSKIIININNKSNSKVLSVEVDGLVVAASVDKINQTVTSGTTTTAIKAIACDAPFTGYTDTYALIAIPQTATPEISITTAKGVVYHRFNAGVQFKPSSQHTINLEIEADKTDAIVVDVTVTDWTADTDLIFYRNK